MQFQQPHNVNQIETEAKSEQQSKIQHKGFLKMLPCQTVEVS